MKSMDILEALTDMNDELILLTETDTRSSKGRMRKFGGVRWLKSAAVAAAAVMLMTVSAYAADAVFNDGAIMACISEKITDRKSVGSNGQDNSIKDSKPAATKPQEKVPDNKETELPESFTSCGATITPISAITDGSICYLRIRLEAPKSVVLEDLPESRKYEFSGNEIGEQIYAGTSFETKYIPPHNVKVTTLPDSDPTDNVKEFLLEMYSYGGFGYTINRLRVIIPGLWVRGVSTSSERNYYSKLFGAEFEIEFPMQRRNEKIDMKNLEVRHYVEKYDFMLNLERVIITPHRLEIHYTATLPEDENVLPDGGYAQIVMKDGTRLIFGDNFNFSDGPDTGYELITKLSEYWGLNFKDVAREYNCDRSFKYGFEEALVLDEIDYIIWCGGQIIDVN